MLWIDSGSKDPDIFSMFFFFLFSNRNLLFYQCFSFSYFLNFRHVEDYMIGIEIIVKSSVFLPFELHKWYVDAVPLRCKSCGQTVFNYNSVMKFCRSCTEERMPLRSFKPFPSIQTLPPKYDNIPDVECVLFPISRISDGAVFPRTILNA